MATGRPRILMRLPVPERDKVDLGLPVCTLDVNQIAIRPGSHLRPELCGLACLEYNYFNQRTVELCVTPETPAEISQGIATSSLGTAAYHRICKSQLFKARPASTVLDLTTQEADELWSDVRQVLWSGIPEGSLVRGQLSDVSQLFFHVVCSSSVANAAFVTLDHNFLSHASDLRRRYGITVLSPNDTWGRFAAQYHLLAPTDSDIDELLKEQQKFFEGLRSAW